MNKSIYYQAHVVIKTTNLFVSTLKFYEHLAFDRTLNPQIDAQNSIFEFFVPESQENNFLQVMTYLESLNLVSNIVKSENRL